jgi:hypothetical protein
MRRLILPSLLTTAALGALISTSACSGGDIAVGRTDQTSQALQKKSDGTATGDGHVCSWDGTVFAKNANASATPYAVGASFPSPDGCNQCNCSAEGILCTIKVCPTPPICPAIAKACPGGSGVAPTGPNCEFPECPVPPTPTPCPALAKVCPDGSTVSATGPNCVIPECPPPPPQPCPAIMVECAPGYHPAPAKDAAGCPIPQCVPDACPAIAKACPDGSSVTPTGPNCTFPECPCTKAECGPELGMPNYLCPDGKTVAGPGPCARTNGVCGYTIVSCPPSP